jgi:hypothetical protein
MRTVKRPLCVVWLRARATTVPKRLPGRPPTSGFPNAVFPNGSFRGGRRAAQKRRAPERVGPPPGLDRLAFPAPRLADAESGVKVHRYPLDARRARSFCIRISLRR